MMNFVRKLLADRALTEQKSYWTLKVVATELPYWLPTKICTYLMLAYHIPVYAIQIAYFINFLQKRQYNEMIQSGTQLTMTLFALVSTFSSIGIENAVKTCLKEIQKPYTEIDREIEDEIENRSRHVLFVFVIMSTTIVLPYFGLFPLHPGSSEYLLFYRICEDLWPGRQNVQMFFKLTYWFTFPLAGFFLVCPGLILHSVVLRFQAQVRMVGKGFEHINKGYKKVDHVSLRHSGEYQRVTYQRLQQLVKNTIYIRRVANKILDKIQPVVAGIFCAGPLVQISTTIFVMNNMEAGGSAQWSTVLIGISTYTCGISLYWQVCQHLIDETGRLVAYAAKSPWNMWDSKNRKALLLYMMNNETPIEITLWGLFVVNYPLGVQYTRAMYSYSVVFFGLKN